MPATRGPPAVVLLRASVRDQIADLLAEASLYRLRAMQSFIKVRCK